MPRSEKQLYEELKEALRAWEGEVSSPAKRAQLERELTKAENAYRSAIQK
jgi:hypothetical protein